MMLQAPRAIMESGPTLKTIHNETTNTNVMLLEPHLANIDNNQIDDKIEEEDNSWETLETALKGLF